MKSAIYSLPTKKKVQETPAVTAIQPSSEDKKYVRIKIADIKGKIRSNDNKGALEIYDSLKGWLEEKQFTEWDAELQALIRNAKSVTGVHSEIPCSKPQVQKEPTECLEIDIKKIRREMRRKVADVKALCRNGRKEEAMKAISEIEKSLHGNNIKEFDEELENIKKEHPLFQKESQANPQTTPKTKETKSDAEHLMQKGLFAEAKRMFASKVSNSEMAQVCSKLIRAKRNIEQYASGFESVKRSHNATSKQNAIKALEVCLALYKKYNLTTKDIEELIGKYKTI